MVFPKFNILRNVHDWDFACTKYYPFCKLPKLLLSFFFLFFVVWQNRLVNMNEHSIYPHICWISDKTLWASVFSSCPSPLTFSSISLFCSNYSSIPEGIWVNFILLLSGVSKSDDEIVKEVIRCVRDSIGPVAAFKSAVIVSKLPRTRSGKISRQTVAAMANGENFKVGEFCGRGGMGGGWLGG